MQSEEGEETKYVYKFNLEARVSGQEGASQPSKQEVQAYINELLGVKKENKPQPDKFGIWSQG